MYNFKEFKAKAHTPKLDKMNGDWAYRIERSISVRISYALLKLFPRMRANAISLVSLMILIGVSIGLFVEWGVDVTPIAAIVGLLLLYLIVYTDKIDGEVARTTEMLSQRGVYLDRLVHALYPFIFYLVVGVAFYNLNEDMSLFILTLFLAVLSHQYLFFSDARQAIKQKVQDGMEFYDPILVSNKPFRGRGIFRYFEYMTFMIYLWTLFFYIAVFVIALHDLELATYLYTAHVVWSLIRLGYYVFYRHPRHGLLRKTAR